MVIMVTGGAGYVGSHTCIELIRAGYSVLIFDDFSNSSPEVVNRIERSRAWRQASFAVMFGIWTS